MPRIHFLSQNRPGNRMGMGHYERLLLEHLLLHAPREEWNFDLSFDGRAPQGGLDTSTIDPILNCRGCLGFSTQRLLEVPRGVAQWSVARALKGPKPDLFHSLALMFPPPSHTPSVFTIHDLPATRFDDEGRIARWAKPVAQNARAIIVPSKFAREELISALDLKPERVHVVLYGLESAVFHPDVAPLGDQKKRELGLPDEYLLYVGGATRRKNVAALLEAWRTLAPQFPHLHLVLAGPQEALGALASASGAPRVLPLGYVGRDVMPHLVKSARAMVFPSIYEGFGMPPQESMALGVPTLVSRAGGAVPEVVGDAALLAADGSAPALRDAMETLLQDPELQAQLRAAGPERAKLFSWHRYAQSVIDIYRQVLAE